MPDIQQLRQTYRELPDGRLRELAVCEASDLTPEAAQVLSEELSRRGFPETVRFAAAAHARAWTEQETELLLAQFRQLPCPRCAAEGQLLNGFKVITVQSIFLHSRMREELIIACPGCIERAAMKATQASAALGWWSLPLGPARTLFALAANSKVRTANQSSEPTPELKEFVLRNVGQITLQLRKRAAAPGK